jgi:regulatory protein
VTWVREFGAQEERAGYRIVELDGRQVALPVVALASLGLGVHDSVPEHLRSRVARLARIELTYQTGLRVLQGRARTQAELRRALLEGHQTPETVDAALERLAAHGWLDDRRLAEEYAARRARGARGPARLVLDLVARGIHRGTAEAAVRVAFLESGADSERAAEALARRRAARLSRLPAVVRRRRLLAYLARRGFRDPQVRAVVDRVCDELRDVGNERD